MSAILVGSEVDGLERDLTAEDFSTLKKEIQRLARLHPERVEKLDRVLRGVPDPARVQDASISQIYRYLSAPQGDLFNLEPFYDVRTGSIGLRTVPSAKNIMISRTIRGLFFADAPAAKIAATGADVRERLKDGTIPSNSPIRYALGEAFRLLSKGVGNLNGGEGSLGLFIPLIGKDPFYLASALASRAVDYKLSCCYLKGEGVIRRWRDEAVNSDVAQLFKYVRTCGVLVVDGAELLPYGAGFIDLVLQPLLTARHGAGLLTFFLSRVPFEDFLSRIAISTRSKDLLRALITRDMRVLDDISDL